MKLYKNVGPNEILYLLPQCSPLGAEPTKNQPMLANGMSMNLWTSKQPVFVTSIENKTLFTGEENSNLWVGSMNVKTLKD